MLIRKYAESHAGHDQGSSGTLMISSDATVD